MTQPPPYLRPKPGQSGPQPPPRPRPEPWHDDSTRRWTLAEKALSVAAGVLAVISAVLALQAAQISSDKDEAQQAEESRSEDLSSLQRQFDQLKNENSSLKAENERLRGDAGISGPTADPLSPSTVSIRHSGQITLAINGNGIDLDSPASNPQRNSGDTDFYYSSVGSLAFGRSSKLLLGQTEANYDSCRESTGYDDSNISGESFVVGEFICVKTSESRFSALKTIAVSSRSLSFDVVTYDPPESG